MDILKLAFGMLFMFV